MDNKMTAEQALEIVKANMYSGLPVKEREAEALRVLLAALSAPRVPAGWIIRRGNDGAIVVQNHGIGGYAAREMGGSGIAETILYRLADAMLAASPEPVAQSREVVGITVAEVAPDTQQVIADLRAEVEALRAEKDALIDLSNGLDKMYRKLRKVIALAVWQLAWCPGKAESVIKNLRKSISDAARQRDGSA